MIFIGQIILIPLIEALISNVETMIPIVGDVRKPAINSHFLFWPVEMKGPINLKYKT